MGNPINIEIYSLEPVLIVNNMQESLDYYKKIGFTIDWTWPDEGEADHASISLGPGHGDHDDDHEEEDHDHGHIHIQLSLSDDTPVPNSGWLYFRLEQVDELYEAFKSRGAEFYEDLADRPWGMREFDLKDVNGHRLRFATPLDP